MERSARSPRVPGNRPQSISLNLAGALAVLVAAIATTPVAAQDDDRPLCGRAHASPEAIALAQRGLALTQQRRLDEAEKDLDHAVEIDPSFAEAIANRANFWTVVHNRERAIADADRAV